MGKVHGGVTGLRSTENQAAVGKGTPAPTQLRAGLPAPQGPRHLSFSEPPRLGLAWPLVQILWFESSEVGGIRVTKAEVVRAAEPGGRWPRPAAGARLPAAGSPQSQGARLPRVPLAEPCKHTVPCDSFVTKAGSEFEQEPRSAIGPSKATHVGTPSSPGRRGSYPARLPCKALAQESQREEKAPVCGTRLLPFFPNWGVLPEAPLLTLRKGGTLSPVPHSLRGAQHVVPVQPGTQQPLLCGPTLCCDGRLFGIGDRVFSVCVEGAGYALRWPTCPRLRRGV